MMQKYDEGALWHSGDKMEDHGARTANVNEDPNKEPGETEQGKKLSVDNRGS